MPVFYLYCNAEFSTFPFFSSLSSIPFVLKFDFLGYNNRKQFGERTAFADKKETIMKMPFLKVQFSYRNEKLRFLLGHQKS